MFCVKLAKLMLDMVVLLQVPLPGKVFLYDHVCPCGQLSNSRSAVVFDLFESRKLRVEKVTSSSLFPATQSDPLWAV